MTFIPALGIGITYCDEIEPILKESSNLVDVLEIEPQTMWFNNQNNPNPYSMDEDILSRFSSFSCTKLIHGIGFPVGGVQEPDPYQLPLLNQMISSFQAPWMSEHLSFNFVKNDQESFKTGFLLPPRQNTAGINYAINSIQSVSNHLRIPFAVETGVNYLRPRKDEIPDGEFVASVVNNANCGILLDLHNIWTNEINGRQSMREFLDQIPLDRVWEVHLAGGMEYDGYWLDAHSGAIPGKLIEKAKNIIPCLPNLGAIIYEIFPSFVETVGLELVCDQLKILHKLWNLRKDENSSSKSQSKNKNSNLLQRDKFLSPTPQEWEHTLGSIVIGRPVVGSLAEDLLSDPGTIVIKNLIKEFRGSMIIDTMKLTARLVILNIGTQSFRELLDKFWAQFPPQLFGSLEGERFAEFLENLHLPIPYLSDILAYEKSVLETLIDKKIRNVNFQYDPLTIIRALSNRRLPSSPNKGHYIVEITPEDFDYKNEAHNILLKRLYH